jgi:transcriptional regulator with XRE-family HTH domain
MTLRYSNETVEGRKRAQGLIGARIKDARLSRGMTQKDLAEKFGKSNMWLSVIENGENSILLLDLLRVAEETGYDLMWFVQDIVKAKPEGQAPEGLGDWHSLYPGEPSRAMSHYQLDVAFSGAPQETNAPQRIHAHR